MTESVFDQGSWPGMVSAYARVDIREQRLALLSQDAPLQHVAPATPIEFAIDQPERLGLPS